MGQENRYSDNLVEALSGGTDSFYDAQENEKSKKIFKTEKEYKDYLEKEFGNLNQPHTDDDGVSLRFEKYFVKNDSVTVSIVGFDSEPRFRKKLSREAFEEFVRKPAGSRGTIEALFNLKRKKKKAEPEEEKAEEPVEESTKEPIEEPTEEIDPTRAAAWHTIRKFQDLPESSNRTYDELNAGTEEERIEKFKKLSRELWDEFTVHGIVRFDKKTGQLYVEKRSDLDGESFLKLLELAGMSVDRSKVNFVAPGGTSDSGIVGDTSEKNGVIAEESGKRVTFDHHAKESTRDTSATKFLYKTLVKLKFFDDEQKAYLGNYVKFVTKFDNLNFAPEEEGEIYANYHENLYGLASKMSVDDMLELMKQGTDPNKSLPSDYLKSHTFINPKDGKKKTLAEFSHFLKKQKHDGEEEIPRLDKKGFVLDSGDDRFGKILVDTMKKTGKNSWNSKLAGDNVTRQLAAFQRGYGAIVTWSPQENKFYVSTRREMNEESIPGGFSQGKNVRGHLLTNGGGNGAPVSPEFLQEILGKLVGKDNFQIEGELKKAIELDEKSKEMLNLFDENKLTESDLRKAAGERGVLLKDLLEAMLSQRDKLRRDIEKEIKNLPKGTVPDRNRITVDFLLECQEKNGGNQKAKTEDEQKSQENKILRSKYFGLYQTAEQLKKALENDYGKGSHFDVEGSSFEINTCSVEDDTITLDVRFKGRPYVGTNCDSMTMSIDDFESLMLGLKQKGKLKGLLKYVPIDGDEDFIAFGKNSEKKPEQEPEFQAIRKRYHKLLAKIHIDLFPFGKYSQEVRDQSNELTKEITNAFGNLKKAWKNRHEAIKSNTLTGDIENAWTSSLNKFNELEIEAGEFLDKVSVDNQAETEAEKAPDMEKPEEEKPEMSEEEKEQIAKTEELETLVGEARNLYVREDYRVTNLYRRLERVLGSFIKNKVYGSPDIKKYQESYIEAIEKLKNYKIELIRKEYADLDGLPPEEKATRESALKAKLAELVTYFNHTEKLNLSDTRTNARATATENNFGKKTLEIMGNTVNRYRKLNWKTKLALSGVLLAGGAGATALATAGVAGSAGLVAFMGALKITHRVFGGAAAGVGAVGIQEAVSRKRDEKKDRKDREQILKEVDKFKTLDDKLNSINNELQKKLGMYEAVFEREKKKARNRKIVGFAVGTLVGSGAVAWVMRAGFAEAMEHSETLTKATGFAKGIASKASSFVEHGLHNEPSLSSAPASLVHPEVTPIPVPTHSNIPPVGAPSNIPPVAPSGPNLEQILKAPKDIDTEKMVPVSVEKTLDGVEVKSGGAKNLLDVNFKKGDSIEKVLIQKMTDPQGMNLNKAEAGKLAHRMALQYAKEKGIPFDRLNHVQIGDKITFDLEHQKLVDLERMHKMPGHAHVHTPKVAGLNPAENIAQEKIISASPAEAVSNMPSGGQALREAALRDEMMRRPISGAAGSMMAGGVAAQKYFRSTEKEISKNARSLPEFARAYQGEIVQIGKLRDVAKEAAINLSNSNNSEEALKRARDTREEFEKSYVKVLEKISKDVFIGEGARSSLDSLRSTSADDYLNSDEGKQNPKIINLMAYARKKFGERFPNPKSNETVPKWAHRMNGKILEDAGLELKTGTN